MTQINNSINGVNIEMILDDEEIFKVKTLNALNKNDELKNFVMIKSTHKFCSVDFTIINIVPLCIYSLGFFHYILALLFYHQV
jgi:hypothetical protein